MKKTEVDKKVVDFYELYSEYDDDKIMHILKNRKSYRDIARDAALKIAIERNLIFSEQDLLSPEFRNDCEEKSSLFPLPNNEYAYIRLFNSVFRFLHLFTLLPLIYGILKLLNADYQQAALGICVGAIWTSLVVLSKKHKRSVFFFLLLSVLVVVGTVVCLQLADASQVRTADIVMLVVGLVLPAYFLFYAKKLATSKSGIL